MTKQYSGYTIGNDIKLYYVILDDGFDIYFGENATHPMYHQPEPFIPNPDISYEENALAMCKDLATPAPQSSSDIGTRLTAVEANVDYLMLLNDSTEE